MSFIQQIENEQFEAAHYDRFAGFDRGDIGRNDHNSGKRIIGSMTNGRGQRVEIVEFWCDFDSFFSVLVNGTEVYFNEDRAEASAVARSYF